MFRDIECKGEIKYFKTLNAYIVVRMESDLVDVCSHLTRVRAGQLHILKLELFSLGLEISTLEQVNLLELYQQILMNKIQGYLAPQSTDPTQLNS